MPAGPDNFDTFVNGKKFALVEFYAPCEPAGPPGGGGLQQKKRPALLLPVGWGIRLTLTRPSAPQGAATARA